MSAGQQVRDDVGPRSAELERRLEAALGELDRLTAVESVRRAVLQFCRGLDRLDRPLMESVFLPTATVDYGQIFRGPVAGFLDATMVAQTRHGRVQHLVGNVLVEVSGDRAVAESYELAHHTTSSAGGTHDLVLAMRTLDEFERHEGRWLIRHRVKVSDWSRPLGPPDPTLPPSPLTPATRDSTDESYLLFAAGAHRRPESVPSGTTTDRLES